MVDERVEIVRRSCTLVLLRRQQRLCERPPVARALFADSRYTQVTPHALLAIVPPPPRGAWTSPQAASPAPRTPHASRPTQLQPLLDFALNFPQPPTFLPLPPPSFRYADHPLNSSDAFVRLAKGDERVEGDAEREDVARV